MIALRVVIGLDTHELHLGADVAVVARLVLQLIDLLPFSARRARIGIEQLATARQLILAASVAAWVEKARLPVAPSRGSAQAGNKGIELEAQLAREHGAKWPEAWCLPPDRELIAVRALQMVARGVVAAACSLWKTTSLARRRL